MTIATTIPAATSSVYECPECGEQTTERRCPDCQLFTRRLGPGGHCPSCDELVLIEDILTTTARSTTGTYTDGLTSSTAVRSTQFVTGIVDLTPGRPARLLDVDAAHRNCPELLTESAHPERPPG